MAIQTVENPKVVYLVERAPPPPAHPVWIDRVKHVAGVALVLIGLAILIGATLALTGHLTGCILTGVDTIHPYFMTGITCAIGGFHLARGNSPSASTIEISAGPLAVSI